VPLKLPPGWKIPLANEFLERRRSELAACDPNKSFRDCFIEAMIDLVGNNTIPLDPLMRIWIAEEMDRLYHLCDRDSVEVDQRRLTREGEIWVFEEIKRYWRSRGESVADAENKAAKKLNKSVDALRQRIKRARPGTKKL
jgi:hypothetical protein